MHDQSHWDRRMLLQRAMLLVGATVLPAGDLLAAPKKGKSLFSPPQLQLLDAVADTIVPVTDTPGALAAGVPKLVEALLRDWASPDHRTKMIASLDTIDVAARAQTGKKFADLSADERFTFLKAHDSAALRPVPGGKPEGLSIMLPVGDPGYAKLKELIVVLYYQSETALTTELEYEHAPGQWQPSVPLTPESRAAGGYSTY